MVAPGRLAVGFVALAAALTAGCDASSPYRAALQDQARCWEDVARVLTGVTDKNSMRVARAQLAARFEDCEQVRERALQLPEPTMQIREQTRAEAQGIVAATQKVLEQVRRINALPDGPEFLASFAHIQGFLGDKAP